MSKSAPKIEKEIRQALSTCSLPAVGAWTRIRHMIETSPRAGHLRTWEGVPIPDEVLAQLFRVDLPVMVALIGELERVGLVGRLGPKLYSDALARIRSRRASQCRRTARHDSKTKTGALANTPLQNEVAA